ncbi:MAG: hypothetical protein HKN87_19240 [Saprospiraceae bacterium]|nr:hypothetical protein [Saprospiraceae bacterium]
MHLVHQISERIFANQQDSGFWKTLPESHKYYPDYLHYVPNFKATLWTLIMVADIKHPADDTRIQKPLEKIKKHFFDPKFGIYSLKEDHFPIPCLNGNMVYIDSYFNGSPGQKSLQALQFFSKYQRFDDGTYLGEKNEFCSNTSCYGKHTCYWGIVKLLKGISFIPQADRTDEVNRLAERCIDFILLHKVCYSSRNDQRIMINRMDKLTFPNMYKSDFLEILWLLKREKVKSDRLIPALDLLKSKQQLDGNWYLERKVNNLATSTGPLNRPNPFITHRAREVLDFYQHQ